jgi:SAM-dependent methyltransferase
MFLSRRATQAEYFDARDRPRSELVESYAALARLNRWFIFAEPFQRLVPRLLGREQCHKLSFLDLGAGDGSLGTVLRKWASTRRGWDWRFTNLDLSTPALELATDGTNVAGSVLDLPFRDASFDVVIASQMTHHLVGDEEVIRHFREAWRVARRLILLTDLHRGPALYGVVWLVVQLSRYPKHFRHDALLSVRRGFRVRELHSLAARADITGAQAWLYYGSRVIVQARKN